MPMPDNRGEGDGRVDRHVEPRRRTLHTTRAGRGGVNSNLGLTRGAIYGGVNQRLTRGAIYGEGDARVDRDVEPRRRALHDTRRETGWPLRKIISLESFIVGVNPPIITRPLRLQSLPYCNTIARPLRNIRSPTNPCYSCHVPCNIGDSNIV